MLDGSIRPESLSGSEEPKHVRQVVMRAYGGDPSNAGRILRVAGCEQRQPSRKTDRQHAHFWRLQLAGKILRCRTDEIGGLGFHSVVGNASYLRRHDLKTAGGQRACEVHQAWLVDAQLVHAVHGHDARSEEHTSELQSL